MGQRSQVYIRYKNKKNLVAMHLQWNYGYYMINRTYQLLDFINKNLQDTYNNFQEENFDISNNHREDIDILHNLIQFNTTIGSYVKGIDLIKENYDYFNKENKDTFKMIPKEQDNNNGILVIDIQENGKIKYGLAGGYEEIESMNFDSDFTMINAKTYFDLSENNLSDNKYKLENRNFDLYCKVMEQIKFIDSFELLTQKEYEEIFNQEYSYKECLKEKDLIKEENR